jgi:hypothetical protein
MKESLLAYEKIILNFYVKQNGEKEKHRQNVIDDVDKKYIFQMFEVIMDKFGTED